MIKALMYKFLAYELWTTDWYIENISTLPSRKNKNEVVDILIKRYKQTTLIQKKSNIVDAFKDQLTDFQEENRELAFHALQSILSIAAVITETCYFLDAKPA